MPHLTVSSFDQIPLPVSKALGHIESKACPKIKALVLDKDNCFAVPKQNVIYHSYKVRAFFIEVFILTLLLGSLRQHEIGLPEKWSPDC